MHECGRLQRVVGAFAAEMVSGEAAQFVIDDGHQRIERGPIPVAPGYE